MILTVVRDELFRKVLNMREKDRVNLMAELWISLEILKELHSNTRCKGSIL